MRSIISVFESRQKVNVKCRESIDLLFSGKSNQNNTSLEIDLKNAVFDLESKTGIDSQQRFGKLSSL